MHSSQKSAAQSLCACHWEDPKYSYLLGYGQPQRDDQWTQVPRCIRAAFPRHTHSLLCPKNDSQGTTVSLWDHWRALQSVSSCHCSNGFAFLNCLCAAGCGPTSGSQRNILKSKYIPRDEFGYIWIWQIHRLPPSDWNLSPLSPSPLKSLGFSFSVLVLAGLAHSLHWTEFCSNWIQRTLLTFMQQYTI